MACFASAGRAWDDLPGWLWDQLFGTLDPEYKARFRQRG